VWTGSKNLRRTGIGSLMHGYDTALLANEYSDDWPAKVKINVHFCAGISGFLALATVIVWIKVCCDADVDGNVVIGGVCTQPKETLICGTILDCRAAECHLYVMLQVNSTASFSATDWRGTTGPQVGLEAEIKHNTTYKSVQRENFHQC